MPAPYDRRFLPDLSHNGQVTRYLDNHYHLEMTANNTGQIVAYQSQMLRMQHEAAVVNLRGMAEIAHRQDATNSLIGQTNNLLADGFNSVNSRMDTLNATASEMNSTLHTHTGLLANIGDAINEQSEIISAGFANVANQMLEQQRVLERIEEQLATPYKQQVGELLTEGVRALHNGMVADGRDQKEEYNDALRLLGDVLQNPIGSRNYVAWFQLGWLRWKFLGNLPQAEEAFYQASRLSRPQGDAYHIRSLRHQVYAQYLQNKFDEAYATIGQARAVLPDDYDILYDAARYAAKTNRSEEATALLSQCIDIRPETSVVMFSEGDFLS